MKERRIYEEYLVDRDDLEEDGRYDVDDFDWEEGADGTGQS